MTGKNLNYLYFQASPSSHSIDYVSSYRSPNIVRVIKSRTFRWAGHVARMEENRNAFKILTGKPRGNRPFKMA